MFYNDSFPCQPGFIRLCYFSFVRGVTVNHVESRRPYVLLVVRVTFTSY